MAESGRCLCGAVSFTADSVETEHHVCHCGMCRRWSGGPVFAAIASGVRFDGDEHLGRYTSSDWAERGFCRRCGTSLFYHLKPKGIYLIGVGAFDDAAKFRVGGEIYIDMKPPGYALAGDHERLTEAETVARFMSES